MRTVAPIEQTRPLESIQKQLVLEQSQKAHFDRHKVREKQNLYEVFFSAFLFFISKARNMRWKKLTLVFDENASFSFYGPSKFFRFWRF